ncbi:MAG: heme-binding protein [Chloroflexales bacterium]|nr:heme-binding protein [Chloroflexales bacterium]
MTMIRTRQTLNLAGAEAVMSAAEAYAQDKGYRVAIAIVDSAGNPLLLRRLPGTQVVSAQVAIDKARTAAIFVRPSRVLEEQVSGGRIGALALHGAAPLIGGIPLTVDGEVVGAIGTSGETPDEDEAVSLAGSRVDASVDAAPALTYEGAQTVANAAAQAAMARGVAPVVAVVDAFGELLYLWRPDAAQIASVNVATDKARSAALYRRPSKVFEDQAAQGRPSALALARLAPLQGGIPIMVDGQVAGAIGVSGASSAPEDSELAELGANALASAPEKAPVYIPHDQVAAMFAKGGFMVETGSYIVDAGRREVGGQAEMHAIVTDIMHIQEGTATMLAGGALVDSREIAPGDFRAPAIEGGTLFQLSQGDVFIAPNGVPHQFTETSNPLLYYVVKVIHRG